MPETEGATPGQLAWFVARVGTAIRDDIPSPLARVLDEIELPTLDTLADMELAGVAVSHAHLSAFSTELATRADAIAADAFAAIGREVNLGSPKQLQEVLFDDLQLPKTRKTKTGYSTDAAVLADLQESNPHPFLDLLLQHREATKLRPPGHGAVFVHDLADNPDRLQTGDPRQSIEERYQSRGAYIDQVAVEASKLVDAGYLLAEDVSLIISQARRHWDYLMQGN